MAGLPAGLGVLALGSASGSALARRERCPSGTAAMASMRRAGRAAAMASASFRPSATLSRRTCTAL